MSVTGPCWDPRSNAAEPAGPSAWRLIRKTTASVLLSLGVVILLVVGWPHQLGGRFGTTVVVGHSMDPTYATGDLLFTAKQPSYHPGEVIVYAVQYGEANGTVVHRITEEQAGQFTTQGDNNPYPDPWPVTPEDIRGTVVLHVPHAGWAVLVTKTPIFLMFLCGALVTYLLWPRGDQDREEWAAPSGPRFAFIAPPGRSTPADTRPSPVPPAPRWVPPRVPNGAARPTGGPQSHSPIR